MSALTHKVDPDEPVNNLIAVVHRRLESLYNDPDNNIVLIRITKIIDEPELSFETSTGNVLEPAARHRNGNEDDDERAVPQSKHKMSKRHCRGGRRANLHAAPALSGPVSAASSASR